MSDKRIPGWLEDYQMVRLVKDQSMHIGYRIYGMGGGAGIPAGLFEVCLWKQIQDLRRENYNLRRRVERLDKKDAET